MSEEAIGLDVGRGRSPGGSGRLFPDATLPSLNGEQLSLQRYRGRAPLILLMLGAGEGAAPVHSLLELLYEARDEISAEGGVVLAITASDRPSEELGWRWPFPLLLDHEAVLHRRVGAVDPGGAPAPTLFITDRFREIYADLRPDEAGWPTTGRDVLEWLTFVEIQCPECNPPEF